MPIRKIPLITGETYHVFNRGVHRQPTFITKADYNRAVQTLAHYRFSNPQMRLSHFLKLGAEECQRYQEAMAAAPVQVDVLAFCLMPNHFHLLLRQRRDGGISRYLANLQICHTRYFNTRHDSAGPIFQTQFKVSHIETIEQLLHVSRYIHLNPYTGSIVSTPVEIETYPWSSINAYKKADQHREWCELNTILSGWEDPQQYIDFVLDNADYQRQLGQIKHLCIE